ncbi:MAG: polyprenyl synthetase family protein [Planctomycetes bacterium]|nr:polyprenyl synthetase family protein [Planctomycetota bacterium]
MTEQEDIRRFIERLRPQVERELECCLPPAEAEPARLHAAMRYAVCGGGKRLRPICVLLGAAAVRGPLEAALPAACAVELLHTYSLIHDDLPCMDDDDLRRGRPTVHRVYGEALALLAGDGLLTLAFEVLAARLAPPQAARAAAVLGRAAGSLGMVGGQVLDLAAEGRRLAEEEILLLDRKKTAALFSASFQMGGICGGAEERQLEVLGRIGADLGTTFQIVDDLLDLRGTPEELGKAAQKDRERGKATLPDLLGEAEAAARARSLSEAACDVSRGLPAPDLIVALARLMLQRSR